MHEILTVQCGERANYLGTHFWNFQETYFSDCESALNHDVLYQHGLSPSGMETYLPRVLLYDSARNMGSLRKINQLYEVPIKTDANIEVVSTSSNDVHPFQNSLDAAPDGTLLSEENVRYWSDYNMQFYHPTSYLPVDSTAVERPLLTYEQGVAAFKERNSISNIMDEEYRPFLEQCDLLQGFNLVSSTCDGWSGFVAEMLAEIADEYPKASKFFIDASEAVSGLDCLNASQTILASHDLVDIFVPLSSHTSWMSSALPGLWLETISLPIRTKTSSVRMSDLASFMSPHHKIFHAGLGNQRLAQIKGQASSTFNVVRAVDVTMSSRLLDGSLVTTYSHSQQLKIPAAFPQGIAINSASLLNIPGGTRLWLDNIGTKIARMQSRARYLERKEIIASLKELGGSYRQTYDESSEPSSDDDGF